MNEIAFLELQIKLSISPMDLMQYKKQNPLKLEQQVKEQDYVKVPVVNEAGEQLETQLFYENAIKAPSDKSIRALQAIVGAHPMVDTTKLENKLIKNN